MLDPAEIFFNNLPHNDAIRVLHICGPVVKAMPILSSKFGERVAIDKLFTSLSSLLQEWDMFVGISDLRAK